MPVTIKSHHQRVKRQMRSDIAQGQNAAIGFLVDEAKKNAPVKSGFLRRSIEQLVKATMSRPTAAAKVGADYGVIADQGGAHRAGTFFWTRAVLAMRQRFPGFFK